MCQSHDQSLVRQSYTQLALERSNDEFGLIPLASCQQFLDDPDLLRLRLSVNFITHGERETYSIS